MGIPFLGILYYFSTIGDFQQLTIDQKYRLERTKPNTMAKTSVIIIYENLGFFEKVIAISSCISCIDRYSFNSPDEYKGLIDDIQLVEINKDSITIEPTIDKEEVRLTIPIIK